MEIFTINRERKERERENFDAVYTTKWMIKRGSTKENKGNNKQKQYKINNKEHLELESIADSQLPEQTYLICFKCLSSTKQETTLDNQRYAFCWKFYID